MVSGTVFTGPRSGLRSRLSPFVDHDIADLAMPLWQGGGRHNLAPAPLGRG
jgi:hypothetical protein